MLRIHNTLTKQKDVFEPNHPGVVRLYSCGLTVYAPMHIGHARTYCFWDMVRRYLEYRGYHVMSVINYTDIDDRIIDKARAGEGGWLDVAERNIARFRMDCRSLRIKDYGVYTRATDFIDEQIEMIRQLLDKDHAYVVDGEVFYSVTSFADYGKLSGRDLDDQQTGASGRVNEDAARKRHPCDFTLWKPSKPGEPEWETGESEWPRGRPGWHIECSAMSTTMLGKQFDVHGGAIDNLFPHHENELAQSEPLCGAPWVRYWMHPEHLDLAGEKMSKSLGNVIGVPDLLDRFRYDEVRWFFSANHYRTKLAYSADIVTAAAEGYHRIARLIEILESRLSSVEPEKRRIPAEGTYRSLRTNDLRVPTMRHRYTSGAFQESSARFIHRFIESMDDDFGSPRATAALFDYVGELYSAGIESSEDWPSVQAAYETLTRHLYVFGLEFPSEQLHPELAAECAGNLDEEEILGPYRKVLDRMLELRAEARTNKDYQKADLIRDLLTEAGVTIEDTKQGTRWLLT